MKKALLVAILTATFLTTGPANAINSKPRHCQADSILKFQGWNTGDTQKQQVGPSMVRFIPHQEDPTRAPRETKYTVGRVTLCV
jgi:hypothetical protein